MYPCSDRDGESDDKEDEDRDMSLAEMFEQIRHCRYIRHYKPDGSASEEYY